MKSPSVPKATSLLLGTPLLLWGGMLVYFWASGRSQNYLHPFFLPGIPAAGFLLLGLGMLTLFWIHPEECCEDPGCPRPAHSTLSRAFRWIVLVIPFPAAALISPGQFGASTVLNRGLVHDVSMLPGLDALRPQPGTPGASDPSMDPSAYLQKTPEGRILAETIDLLFAANEEGIRGDFEGREIEIIGQFLPETLKNPDGDRFNLLRIFIMCCAADGRPVAVTVRAPAIPELEKMQWLRVRGRALFPIEGGRRIPLIEAESVEPVEAPSQPFLY